MTLSASSILHAWSARHGLTPRVGFDPVHARNSAASFQDAAGVLRSAIPNTPRLDWDLIVTPNYPNGERRQTLLVEAALTETFTYTDDLSNAAWTLDAATVTANATLAPDSTLSATKLKEDNTNAPHGVRRSISPTSGLLQAMCAIVKPEERTWVFVQINDADGNTYRQWFNLATGAKGSNTSTSANVMTAARPVQYAGGSWLLRCYWKDHGGANPASISVRLATGDGIVTYAGTTGSGVYVSRFNYFKDAAVCPSPVSATSATVTTAADAFSFRRADAAQAQMIYCRFIEGGTQVAGERVWQIGDQANGSPRLFVFSNASAGAGQYTLFHSNATTIVQQSVAAIPTIGDTVEHVAILFADGSVQLLQSINAGAVTASGQSGANTIVSPWGGTYLNLGSNDGLAPTGCIKFADWFSVKYADVVSTTSTDRMAELRAFADQINAQGQVIS